MILFGKPVPNFPDHALGNLAHVLRELTAASETRARFIGLDKIARG
jgi:hypothetical protein